MPYTLLKRNFGELGVEMVHDDNVYERVKRGDYEFIDVHEGITKYITIVCVSFESACAIHAFVVSLLENLPAWTSKVTVFIKDRVVCITTTTLWGVYIDSLCQLIDGQTVDGHVIQTYPKGTNVIVRGCCNASSSSSDESDDYADEWMDEV